MMNYLYLLVIMVMWAYALRCWWLFWVCDSAFIYICILCDGLDWQTAKKAYALLMPLSVGIFLRWEFCSNGTTCMCIVIESHLMLHLELWWWYICCCFMLLTCCDKYYLKVVNLVVMSCWCFIVIKVVCKLWSGDFIWSD